MAHNSVWQDSNVDPDKFVYMEMEGIMKVVYSSEDIDYEDEPDDFLTFKRKVREIPDDFCLKNTETFFYGLVCKSMRPLRTTCRGVQEDGNMLAQHHICNYVLHFTDCYVGRDTALRHHLARGYHCSTCYMATKTRISASQIKVLH